MIQWSSPPWARLIGAALLALFLQPAPRLGAEGPSMPQKVVTVEGITEYRFDNGLRLLLFPDTSTPKVTVNMTVLVGSRHEGYGETGMAHLLEHMVFKGTPSHPDVPKALKDRGAEFNGTTWVDRTNYFETLAATEDNLEFAIGLEADRLVNSFIKREDLASEMTVVRSEFEQGENNPVRILRQRMLAAAYEWHNYGKSTIGNRSDIERVPVDRLRVFYRKYYQPDNVMLVVAGNFNEAKALELVAKHFGKLKKPDRALDTTYTEEPPQDGERSVTLRRVGGVGLVGAVYHTPAGSHEDFAALEVLATVLSAEPSGKLYKDLVTTKKATGVSAIAFGWHDPGVIEFLVEADKSQKVEDVRDALVALLDGLPAEQFTEADVERAKARLATRNEFLLKNSQRLAVALSDWGAKGDWRLFFLHRDRVAKVTPADVQRVARTYLARNNRTVGVYYPTDKPERATVPPTPDVAALVKEYKGGAAVSAGEAFDYSFDNITKRTQLGTLSTGVKTALLTKKSRGDQVQASLTLRFGNPESLKDYTVAVEFLDDLMERGTRKKTRQQIEDELVRLKAQLNASASLGSITFTVQCTRDNLPGVLNLLAEILREPSFPAEEFDILKRQKRDALEKQRTEPSDLAGRELRRRLNPFPKGDLRYVPTLDEEVAQTEAVTVEQMRKLYGQLSGEHGELVVVGDFDPAEVKSAFETALRGWKSPTAYQRVERPAKTDVKGEHLDILTPDKANAVYMAALMLPLTDADPDHAPLAVANFLFGGGSLSSRLGNRVRQKEGLSYGVGSGYVAASLDKSATFRMFAIYNPLNKAKLNAVIEEELEKALKEGIPAAEVETAKAAYLAQLKQQRSGDTQVVGLWQRTLYAGRTLEFQADYEKRVAALTADEVNAAFRKHIDPKRLVVIQAGDFKKEK